LQNLTLLAFAHERVQVGGDLVRVCGKSVHEILCDTLILQVTRPLGKLYFWGECPNSGGGFQPPRSGWKPLPLCAAKLREGHTSKVRPKGDKFFVNPGQEGDQQVP